MLTLGGLGGAAARTAASAAAAAAASSSRFRAALAAISLLLDATTWGALISGGVPLFFECFACIE